MDLIAVAPTFLFLHHVAGFDQITDDVIRTTFGDAEAFCDVPQARVRVTGDAEQGLAVNRKEVPRGHTIKIPEKQ